MQEYLVSNEIAEIYFPASARVSSIRIKEIKICFPANKKNDEIVYFRSMTGSQKQITSSSFCPTTFHKKY